MIKQITLVAFGGAAGSVSRYLISLWGAKRFDFIFPLSTFIINITGCFIIGFLIGLSMRHFVLGNELKLLLIVGFCGGYTTFSTFSAENLKLIETGNFWTFAAYTAGSILFGLIAVWSGNILSKIV